MVDLKKLKNDSFNLENLDDLILALKNNPFFCKVHIKSIDSIDATNNLLAFNLLITCFLEKQIISERIQSLVHDLTKLKITTLTKDFCKARRILVKNLDRAGTNIHVLIKQNSRFLKEIGDLKSILKRQCEILKINHLEDFDYVISRMEKLQKEQNLILKIASIEFIEESKNIISLEKANQCNS